MINHHLAVRKDCVTFAAVKRKCVTYSKVQGTMPVQKSFRFSAFFVPDYLVNPNNLLTHTHTHTICAPIGSVILFHLFLRARKVSASPISKGLFGVPFVQLFIFYQYIIM